VTSRRHAHAPVVPLHEDVVEHRVRPPPRPAEDARTVTLLHLAPLELGGDRRVGLAAARHQEDPRGVPIEALVDTQVGRPTLRDEVRTKTRHEIVRLRGVGRLARHADRLVHGDEIGVLVQDELALPLRPHHIAVHCVRD